MKLARFAASLPLCILLFASPAEATLVKRMDLKEMAHAAGLIFRGTVVDVSTGSIPAGSHRIPIVIYRIRVAEQLKGSYPAGDKPVIEIRSIDIKAIDLPKLAVGEEYLLLMTRPSSAGLSTVVGTEQGVFRIQGEAQQKLAVNGLNNRGLAAGLRGPARYDDLAGRIRSILGEGESR